MMTIRPIPVVGLACLALAALRRRRRSRVRWIHGSPTPPCSRTLPPFAPLLQQGADVNGAQGDGMTALHWAAEHGDRS